MTPRIAALTAAEERVLELLAEGRSDSEIAGDLHISVRTVRSHIDHIRDKLGRGASRVELALIWHGVAA